MLCQNERQPNRFGTQLSANRLGCVRREIAFGEEEIENSMHSAQSRRILRAGQCINTRGHLPQTTACTAESFVHVGFAREESMRNFSNIETAKGLERQDNLRLLGNGLVAAD